MLEVSVLGAYHTCKPRYFPFPRYIVFTDMFHLFLGISNRVYFPFNFKWNVRTIMSMYIIGTVNDQLGNGFLALKIWVNSFIFNLLVAGILAFFCFSVNTKQNQTYIHFSKCLRVYLVPLVTWRNTPIKHLSNIQCRGVFISYIKNSNCNKK